MSSDSIKGKLIKIESLQSSFEQKMIQVKEKDVLIGFFKEWPTLGKSFQIWIEHEVKQTRIVYPIVTTEVKEIIDDRTFRTLNSIYKIVTLEDERDKKISIIVE